MDFVKEHYWDDYIHWLAQPAWNPPTGGETSVEIASRASLVIAEIQKKYATGNVLVVSHKATIRIVLCGPLASIWGVIAIASKCWLGRFASLSLTYMALYSRNWVVAPIWAKNSVLGQEPRRRWPNHRRCYPQSWKLTHC